MRRDAPVASSHVGYIYSSFPPEILHAFGRVPVRLFPSARNAADAEAYLPKNFCAFSKVLLASFLDEAAALPLDGVVFSDECDSQRRLYDVWHAYSSVPVLAFLDLPRRTDPLGVEFYAASLTRCIEQLEERFGQRLTADALASSMRLYNRQRDLWVSLRRAWAEGRVPTARYYALRDARLSQEPELALAEMESALSQAAGASPAADQTARLLLIGSHHVHLGLVDAIAENGRARIVAEDSACDEREPMAPIQADGPRESLVHELAACYLDSAAPRLRNLHRRFDYLAHLASERRVDGVICSYYKFCDLFLAEYPVLKRFFSDQSMPALLLEDEGDPTLSGQARTRLEAFIEMVA